VNLLIHSYVQNKIVNECSTTKFFPFFVSKRYADDVSGHQRQDRFISKYPTPIVLWQTTLMDRETRLDKLYIETNGLHI